MGEVSVQFHTQDREPVRIGLVERQYNQEEAGIIKDIRAKLEKNVNLAFEIREELVQMLKGKDITWEQCNDCLLYHLVESGSEPKTKYFDFEGKLIENFITNKFKQLQ